MLTRDLTNKQTNKGTISLSSLAPLILQLCFCFLSSGSSGHEGKGQILPLVRLWLLDQVHQPLTEKVVSLMLTFPKDFANKPGQKKFTITPTALKRILIWSSMMVTSCRWEAGMGEWPVKLPLLMPASHIKAAIGGPSYPASDPASCLCTQEGSR